MLEPRELGVPDRFICQEFTKEPVGLRKRAVRPGKKDLRRFRAFVDTVFTSPPHCSYANFDIDSITITLVKWSFGFDGQFDKSSERSYRGGDRFCWRVKVSNGKPSRIVSDLAEARRAKEEAALCQGNERVSHALHAAPWGSLRIHNQVRGILMLAG